MAELLTFLQAFGEPQTQTHREMLETLWERADSQAADIKLLDANLTNVIEHVNANMRLQVISDGVILWLVIVLLIILVASLYQQRKRLKRLERAIAGLDSDGDVFQVSTDDGKRLLSMTLAQIRDLVKYTGKPLDLPAGREGLITNGEAR